MGNICIYIVQDFVPSNSARRNFEKTIAPDNLGSLLANPRARVSAIYSKARDMDQALDALTAMTDKIQYIKVNLLEAKSNALDFASPTTHITSTSYEIPFQTTFFIPDNSPQSLVYRVFTHTDTRVMLQNMESSPSSAREIAAINQIGGSVTYEPVITAGELNTRAHVYIDSAGEQWLGPIHQMEGTDSYMKGDVHGDFEGQNAYLTKRDIYNSKINDLRVLQLPPVEDRFDGGSVYYDAHSYNTELRRRQFTAEAYGIQKESIRRSTTSLKTAVLEQLMSPASRRSDYGGVQFDSEMLLTTTPGGACNYLFTIDWAQIVKYQSRLARLYESLPESSFAEVLNQSKIRSMKLWRRRVTDLPVGTNKLGNAAFKVFDENELPVLVSSLSEISTGVPPQAQLNEINVDWSSSGGYYYRTFTGTDTDIATANYGNFQYFIEVEVQDGIHGIMKTHSRELEGSIRFMKDFLETAKVPAFIPGYSGNDYRNMPPNQLRTYLHGETLMKGSYNFETKRYTESFLTHIAISGAESGLATAVRRYLGAYEIVYGKQGASDPSMLLSIINPRRGASPSAIQDFITFLEYLHSAVEEILASKKITNKNDSSSVPMASMFPDKESFKFKIYFDETYDASVINNLSTSYFETVNSSFKVGGFFSGMKVVDIEARVIEEYSQYYAADEAFVNGAIGDVRRTGIKLTPNEYQFTSPQILKDSIQVSPNSPASGFRKNSPEIGFISMNGQHGDEEERTLQSLSLSMSTGGPSKASTKNMSFRTPFVPPVDVVFAGPSSSFKVSDVTVLQTRKNYARSIETTYVSIDKVYDLGISIETPYSFGETSWLQDFEESHEKFISDASVLAMSVSGSGENLCLDKMIASRQPALASDIVNSDASRFLELVANKITTGLSGQTVHDMPGNARSILNGLEQTAERDPNIYDTVPVQIKSLIRNGVNTPGVLSNGDVSPYMFGMMVSVEEKVDTSFGKSGTGTSGSDYKSMNGVPASKVGGKKSHNFTEGKNFKICRVTPYENREIGVSRSKAMEETNVMDRYFLVGVK
jgi:hypothetical protein